MELPRFDQVRFRRVLARAVTLPLIALALFVAVLLLQLEDMLATARLVDHTDQVIAQAYQAQKLLIDLETGLRGYLITGDSAFLDPYNEGQRAVQPALANLHALVSDNPEQSARADEISANYDRWASYAADVLAQRDAGGDYASTVRSRAGKQLMDAMRAEFDQLIQTEVGLRDQRSRSSQRTTGVVIVTSVGLALTVGVALALFSRRQLLLLSHSYNRIVALEQERANMLDEQRERLQVTLTSIGDGVIVTDEAGRVTLMNPVAQALTGWDQQAAAGQPLTEVFQIIAEDTRQVAENPVAKVLAQGVVVGLANHTLLIRRDGTELPIDDSAAPIRDRAGQVSGVVLVFRDVEEQRQSAAAREQLAREIDAQRQRLNTVVANVPGLVWEAWGEPDAASQRIDFVSDYVEPMLGYSSDEWLATPNFWLRIVHPDDQARAAQVANETFRSGAAGVNQFRWLRRDGRAIWVESYSAPILDPAGQPIGMRGVTLDITERKRNQDRRELLMRTSDLLAGSLEYEPALERLAELLVPRWADWVALHLLEDSTVRRLVLAHADPARADLARSQAERYALQPDAQHLVARVLVSGAAELRSLVPEEQLVADARDDEQLALLRALGMHSYICVPLTARGDTFGAITLAMADSGRHYEDSDLALAEELAARVATSVENARLYRQAQDAVRARDQFLSIASHELKTPLTSLIGYTDLVQRRAARDSSLPERDRRAVQIIGEQAARLNRLVTALLDISRIETGQLSIERGVVELNGLTQRLVQEIAQAQPNEIERIELHRSPEPLVVIGDELRLEQVIQNLIQNALKYSPAGGPVTVRLERSGDRACVEVADQGIGIPAAALPNLFRRFYRAPNVEQHQINGMGIGLFVVREIVQLHGGEIRVESQEGAGSAFTIELPLA
jgi:PAS domain S-box-containing protein